MSSSSGDNAAFEGGVVGACLLMTIFGVVVIVATAVADVELVPHSTGLAAGIMAVLAAVGAVIGAGVARGLSR